MKKLLLSLCALVVAVSMNAQYSVGDYIFTATAKYKVAKIVDITQPGTEWNNFSSEIFSPYRAITEDDYDGIKSTRSDEGDFISYAIPLKEMFGSKFILTMKFMATADGSTSITDGAQNQINAWVSSQDDYGVKAGVANIDYQQVASVATVKANEWTEISWFFADTLSVNAELEEPGGFLNVLFSRINTDCVIATNMQLVEVAEVYDTRITDKQIAFAQKLMEDENFNTEAAAGAKEELAAAIELVQSEVAAGTFDDPAQAADFMNGLDEVLNAYLNVESMDLVDYLQYIDITSFPALGRGRINKDYGCFPALLGSWGHLEGTDYMMSAIQLGQKNHTATMNIVNTDFPAGKYFLTAELRNANTGKDSWPCTPSFNLSTYGTTMTIGDTTVEVDTLAGEQYQKFYIIGNVAEDGAFKATIYWPGTGNNSNEGGAFFVRALQVRGFGDMVAKIERKQAWDKFIAQYNAAVNNRANLLAKGENENTPWGRDTIQTTLDKWDPYYNAIVGSGWVDADGKDTGVATNEELLEWAQYQGYEEYNEDGTRIEYAVVRGYQYAINYINEQNKPIADLIAKIADAKLADEDAMNVNGDHETFQAVIKDAEDQLAGIKTNTSDATRDADVETINNLMATLEDAKAAFLESAQLQPIVDIDFSGSFAEVKDPEDESIILAYQIDGKTDTYDGAGVMVFNNPSNVQPDPTIQENGQFWQLGYNDQLLDVLRVGGGANSLATVTLNEADLPTDEDVIRAEFDVWFGKLSKGFFYFELQNAESQRLGGFNYDSYNNAVEFNDFNDADNKGLNLRSYATGQDDKNGRGSTGICVESNKCSFTLVLDYKAKALQGTIVSSKGTCTGEEMPMLDLNDANITDNKVAKIVIYSNYAKENSGATGRRCWFDNLKVFKYPSAAEGPHFEPTVEVKKGDVNEDDNVDINDVVAIINVMAGNAQWANADVNGDENVDINDVVAVINIMAGN